MLNVARWRRGRQGRPAPEQRTLSVGSGAAVVRRPGCGSEQKVATSSGRRYQPPSYSETFAADHP